MLYNKNKVRKVNDKKVLHKKGKHWVTISLGLLAAIGGGALATNATVNANADTTNNTQSQPQTTQILNTNENTTTAKAASAGSADAQSANAGEQTAKAQSNINENNILNTKVTPAPAAHQTAQPSVKQSAPAVHNNVNAGATTNTQTTSRTTRNTAQNAGTNTTAQSSGTTTAKSSVSGSKVASGTVKAGSTSQRTASFGKNLKKLGVSSAAAPKASSNSVSAKSVAKVNSNRQSASSMPGLKSNAKQGVHYASLNTQLSNSAKVNVHFGNGNLNVDGIAVNAVPDNDQDNNNYQAFDNTDLSTNKAQATGNNGNHKDNTKDPYEADPYSPVLNFSFANIDTGDAPVGHEVRVQAHAGDQFDITDNGVSINGKQIQVPNGYQVDSLGDDDTYTIGRYTVMPRMNVDGAWDAESYTVGVKTAQSHNLGAQQAKPVNHHKTMLGATVTGGGTGANNNNIPAGSSNNGGSSNNNLMPSGPIFNNDSGDDDYDNARDSALAALVNNESRDAQGTMNRMQTSAESTESAMASNAAINASNSAATVSLAESGQNAATIQNMNNSSEVNSIANASAENSAENSLRNSDQAAMNNFEGSVNSERATINSDDINALNSLAQMSNLDSAQYNNAVYGMQSAESTYLDQLSHASNAAEWNTITSDYLANLKNVVTDAANANGNNRSNNANGIFNTINSDKTTVNSLLASDGAITSSQASSLDNDFTSDANNASNMAQSNADNSSALTSIANSLASDQNGIESAASLSGMNDSNAAGASEAANVASEDANINSKRNSDINSVDNNPTLTSSEQAQIDSEINSAADGLLASNNASDATGDLAGDKRNATDALNSEAVSDRNYINGNPDLTPAQQSSMDDKIAGMAESGVNAIDQASDDPSVQMAQASAQNGMAKYSGNVNNTNPANLANQSGDNYGPDAFDPYAYDPYNYDPYAYDNGLNPYGTGLTHYDPTEWNNEAQLAAGYAKYLGEGYPLVQLTRLNNDAFHYGLVDAANGLEANPVITRYAPYRDGYTSYASGFHDGEFGIVPANLNDYGELYQKSYQEAYTNGQNYRNNNRKMITESFANGYKDSRKGMLAVSSLEGHSRQYVEGYIQGMNDRLKGHPNCLLVSHAVLLHRAPQFMSWNVLGKIRGGNRRDAKELLVNGVSVDASGNIRYHVVSIRHVRGGRTEHVDGWVTGNHHFVKDTYYRASDAYTHSNVVHILTSINVHSTMQGVGYGYDVVRGLHAGSNVKIRGIVRDGDITRFYIAPGEYITTNKGYVQWLR